MITIIYRLIILFIAVLVLRELFHQRDWKLQANAALVLIPFVIRALMIA